MNVLQILQFNGGRKLDIDLKTAIQQFLIDQELKGNTDRTILFYKKSLNYFTEFIGKDIKVKDIQLTDLKKYQFAIKKRPRYQSHPFKPTIDKPITSVSVQTYIRALRAFLSWMHQEGYIENFTTRFKLPKATKKAIEILSDDEITAVLKGTKTTTELGLRNHCICSLMLDCGLRVNEVISLETDNVHIAQGAVKVLGKGQKERIVPLGVYTKKHLLKYISCYRPMPIYETKRLFLDKECKAMSSNALKMFFARLRKKTKIDRLHPHILRHTFATKYLMNGGDIFSLQQILGHTSLEMVRRYSHLASAYTTKKHKLYSPLDNIQRRKNG